MVSLYYKDLSSPLLNESLGDITSYYSHDTMSIEFCCSKIEVPDDGVLLPCADAIEDLAKRFFWYHFNCFEEDYSEIALERFIHRHEMEHDFYSYIVDYFKDVLDQWEEKNNISLNWDLLEII